MAHTARTKNGIQRGLLSHEKNFKLHFKFSITPTIYSKINNNKRETRDLWNQREIE